MLLYDLFYPDSRDCDFNIPLPKRAKKGTVARCTNGPQEVWVFNGGEWVEPGDDEEVQP